jgi:C1A family cysteine protease
LKTFRWHFVITLLSFIFFFTTPLSHSADVDYAKAAIQAKGARWIARETPFSNPKLIDRPKGLGLIEPVISEEEDGPSLLQYKALVSVPSSLDWRDNGGNFVTPVRNQGSCGSCWAFSTVGALESATLISNGTPGVDLDLSEQTLVSCSNAGDCDYGGYIDYASNFIRDTGIPLESCYPYTARDGYCGYACSDWQTRTYRVSGWSYVANGWSKPATVAALKNGLYTYGPLVVTMYIYEDFYYYYGSGVYSYTFGGSLGGHAVLLVGYHDDPAEEGGGYFITKNSWGDDWGESGYFRIAYSEVNSVVKYGKWTLAYGYALPAPDTETVSSPLYFSGPTNVVAGTSSTYMFGGSSSNLGHSVEYLIDWGDETNSCWLSTGTTSASKTWSIPGIYPIRVKSRCAVDTSIESGWSMRLSVTVSETPLLSVTLLAPDGVDAIPSGLPYRIQWDAPSQAITFKVLYSQNNGATWKTLASKITAKYYDWIVPTPSKNLRNCLVRVVGYNGKVKVGEDRSSLPFTIEVVRVTSLNGAGLSLSPRETKKISWTTNATRNEVGRVTLYYSTNGGASWRLIQTLQENTGVYNWRVPSVTAIKTNCRVKVVLKNRRGTVLGTDASDISFTINPST